jgi:DnaJ family protein C protein 28
MRESRGSMTLEHWIDQQILEAQERGDFDNLAGKGQPLNLTPDPFAQDRELAFKILKDAGFAPEWIELDKAIRSKLKRVRQVLYRSREHREARLEELADRSDKWAVAERQRALASWQMAVASFKNEVEGINKEIMDRNLKVPSPLPQRSRVDVDREIVDLEGEQCEPG